MIKPVKVENIRQVIREQSGLCIVAEEGLVLPPKINDLHNLGRFGSRTEELLDDIRQGESSFIMKASAFSFERVDPSLVGKEVMQISLELAAYKEDRVILYGGKLVKRDRVYPFIPQKDVEGRRYL